MLSTNTKRMNMLILLSRADGPMIGPRERQARRNSSRQLEQTAITLAHVIAVRFCLTRSAKKTTKPSRTMDNAGMITVARI